MTKQIPSQNTIPRHVAFDRIGKDKETFLYCTYVCMGT
nr:unnamed protein product [Callosobruchus chinensis]